MRTLPRGLRNNGWRRTLGAVVVGGLVAAASAVASAARPAPDEAASPAPPTAEQSLQIRWLVGDLRDDPFRFNAMQALWELRDFGDAALPALHGALASDDWQQRQMAAHLLRRMDPGPPTQAMLKVCVEGLANDDLPYGPRRRPGRTRVVHLCQQRQRRDAVSDRPCRGRRALAARGDRER